MLKFWLEYLLILTCWGISQARAADCLTDKAATTGERRVLILEGVEYPFRWCPAGSFHMGSPDTEPDRDSSEILHEVTLTRGFWILETEVTQEMYQSVCGSNPAQFVGPRKPVDSVGWSDAMAFCQKFQEKAGLNGIQCSLPTEAQWEYACRAGTTGPRPDDLEKIAWMGEITAEGSTHDVATKSPNAWGIYDMIGNLWEWCADWYGNYSGNAETDPTGPAESKGKIRVDRGGCWDSKPYECRSAYRGFYDDSRKGPFVGFRFVLVP